MDLFEQPLLLFLALFALYSPIAALPSYFPIVGRLGRSDQRRLAIGLFVNVAIFAMVALWLGEPLLELLGVSTAALTTTGGIALLYEGVALMRGTAEHPTVDPEDLPKKPVDAPGAASIAPAETGLWREYMFVPITFPLTVGGTTFAFFVAFRAEADTTLDVVGLSVAGLLYAAVTAITLYASAFVHQRVSASTASFLDKVAGILLTAIAVTILASGGTRLVVEVLEGLGR
ncbi:MarC family protein [Pseudonocardia lacus]|uniref:MarC family protein n=1 Tax=Pseudonocardia lacus TaxID=2835865 RepID=UPI001BDD2969|nr:MarC family protein [Pseudonocardia lacus]